MHTTRRALVSAATLLLAAATAGACGGLAHSISNDGNDITNPNGMNPGTGTLTISAARTDLGVGDFEPITFTYSGAAVTSGMPFTETISNPSVLSGGSLGVIASSVGASSISVTYQGSTATIGFTVHSQYGLAAIVNMQQLNAVTGATGWIPDTVQVQAGSTVEFHTTFGALSHNVIFDPAPGAPADIALGSSGSAGLDRLFATAGSFSYRCTLHGETGVVNVVSP